MQNKQKALILPPGETAVLEKIANKKQTWYNYIGGRLYLTTEALYFKPNKPTVKNEVIRISLSEIHVLKKSRSLWIIPNRIIIGDRQGHEYTFVVSGRNQFYETVEQQLNL